MLKGLLASSVLLFSAYSFADQCQIITLSQAHRAYRAVRQAKMVDFLCEPCGETVSMPVEVTSVKIKKSSYTEGKQRFYEVLVNDVSIDLAYTYVDGKNLANKIGCEASMVSDQISTDDRDAKLIIAP